MYKRQGSGWSRKFSGGGAKGTWFSTPGGSLGCGPGGINPLVRAIEATTNSKSRAITNKVRRRKVGRVGGIHELRGLGPGALSSCGFLL